MDHANLFMDSLWTVYGTVYGIVYRIVYRQAKLK
jgi:hypothetical protein